MSEWLLPEDIAYLTDIVSTWLAYGIGLGAILWMLSQGVALIYKLVRF